MLDDFLTSIVPHEAAHLKTDIAQIREMLAAWDTDLIDAVLSAAHRSGMTVEDISYSSGYAERYIRSRLRLLDTDDVLVLDAPLPGSNHSKNAMIRRQRNRRSVKLSRPSAAHIMSGQVNGFWLLDPLLGLRKQSKKRRPVRNQDSASIPSGIKWEVPPVRASHRRQVSALGRRVPSSRSRG